MHMSSQTTLTFPRRAVVLMDSGGDGRKAWMRTGIPSAVCAVLPVVFCLIVYRNSTTTEHLFILVNSKITSTHRICVVRTTIGQSARA